LKIAVVGIGKVGLPFAVVASRSHKVVGIDIDNKWIAKLKANVSLVEPDLNEFLIKYPFKKTTDFSEILGSEIVFVVVGSQREGYSVDTVLSSLKMIIPYLVDENQVLTIISTIKPGSMRNHIIPFLSKNKVFQRIRGICYNPVFVALGSAIEYFNNPGYIVIGESNPEAGMLLESFYRKICRYGVKIYHNSLESVEVLKFALNLSLINKICLLNTITEFCEKYFADVDFIAEIMKEDPRIAGKKMFKGGLGFGGTCFPVDAISFRESQNEKNLDTSLIDAIIRINEKQINRTVKLLEGFSEKKISVLGVTYKPNVELTTESQALEITKRISKNKDVMIYDPSGIDNAKKELKGGVRYARTLEEALEFGEIILIAVEWPQFSNISDEHLRKEQIIIDPWRLLKNKNLQTRYIPFGLAPS